MELTVRPLLDTDYQEILVGWWNDWGWTPPAAAFLPQDGEGGVMVMDGDEPVCAGFLYTTNSGVAWVDWIVSSKSYRKKPQRKEAINLLIEKLTSVAKSVGYQYVYALIKNQSLIETYKKNGFVKGDSYVGELIKVL
jgi:hypothetical protein